MQWAWENAKTFKSFFLKTIFMSNLWNTQGSNLGSFSSMDFKFSSFTAKELKLNTMSPFFEILQIF